MKVRGIEMFQSLFFWNHYLDLFPFNHISILYQFQSLFFWNHYLDDTLHGGYLAIFKRFNPCFSGTTT